MTVRFDVVDLSRLPSPAVVEPLDYEEVLAAVKAELAAKVPELTATMLESDPLTKLLEVVAYREIVLRQRVNDSARATMLAYAKGTDLDNLAALVHVARQVVDAGDPDALPPVPPTYESDERLRARALLAWEGLSTAGPAGAYHFHARAASPLVADVAVTSPSPGQVVVTVLSTVGDGVPDSALLATVEAELTDEDVRPLTDQVIVQAAARVDFAVDARISVYQGPDAEVVRAAAEASLIEWLTAQRRLGEAVTIDGLHAALRVEGVRRVDLLSPTAAIEPAAHEVAHCTAITVERVA